MPDFVEFMEFQFERDGDQIEAVLEIGDKQRNVNGVVHGSVIHGMLDTVFGAISYRANDRKPVATAEITIRYLKPAFSGTLRTRSRVVKAGSRVIVLEGEVLQGEEVIAMGHATFVPISLERK